MKDKTKVAKQTMDFKRGTFADSITYLRSRGEHIGTTDDNEGYTEVYEVNGQLLVIVITRIGNKPMEEIYTLLKMLNPAKYAKVQKEMYEKYEYTPSIQTGLV